MNVTLPSVETVAEALEKLAEALRSGHVVAFSAYSEDGGVTRLSIVYAPMTPRGEQGR